MQKLLNRFSQNSADRVAHGSRKKRLDFVGNPDLVALLLGFWL